MNLTKLEVNDKAGSLNKVLTAVLNCVCTWVVCMVYVWCSVCVHMHVCGIVATAAVAVDWRDPLCGGRGR